jgi:hypothetical protein
VCLYREIHIGETMPLRHMRSGMAILAISSTGHERPGIGSFSGSARIYGHFAWKPGDHSGNTHLRR